MNETKPNNKTILIVDDIPANIDVLNGLLSEKYRVIVATSGEKALDICRSDKRPDLVLLDIMMPGMSGYEVLRELKSEEYTREIPVIMVSAVSEMESVQQCLDQGAEDYVYKPVNPKMLQARVESYLR